MSVNTVTTRGYGTFGSIGEVVVRGYLDAAAISSSLGGTVALLEAEVVAGGEITTVSLSNDTWHADIGDDNAITDALIAGFDSDGAEANGWNNTVRDGTLAFGDITRTSDTLLTIVWPATPGYDADTDETITLTLDATTLVTSSTDITATGSITVTTVTEGGVQLPPAEDGGGGAYGWSRKRKKKEQLEQDDQDFLDIVNIALPEIMKYLK